MASEKGERSKIDKIVTQATYGALSVATLGIAGSVFAFLAGDPVGSGVFLIASALAYGLLANALIRQ